MRTELISNMDILFLGLVLLALAPFGGCNSDMAVRGEFGVFTSC